MIKKTIKLLTGIVISLLLIVAGYFAFMTLTDYKPDAVIGLEKDNVQIKTVSNTLTVTTFNIGYATLDDASDFFMDGGTASRAIDSNNVSRNLAGINRFMKETDSDIFLIQEVDKKATRTYKINQYDYFKENYPAYEAIFASNYKVPFVPVPLNEPVGQVHSGLTTLSKFTTTTNTRYQFPGSESWPRQLALLDRCFTESRYTYKDKELIVVNLHMSAYDSGGFMRVQQTEFLQNYLVKEYNKGNYIIVGGDFNQEIPGTDADAFNLSEKPNWLKVMAGEFKNFTWYNDPNIPTNRALDAAYIKGITYVSNIDGFLVSDNITVSQTTVHDLKFKNSDHNPVTIDCILID